MVATFPPPHLIYNDSRSPYKVSYTIGCRSFAPAGDDASQQNPASAPLHLFTQSATVAGPDCAFAEIIPRQQWLDCPLLFFAFHCLDSPLSKKTRGKPFCRFFYWNRNPCRYRWTSKAVDLFCCNRRCRTKKVPPPPFPADSIIFINVNLLLSVALLQTLETALNRDFAEAGVVIMGLVRRVTYSNTLILVASLTCSTPSRPCWNIIVGSPRPLHWD